MNRSLIALVALFGLGCAIIEPGTAGVAVDWDGVQPTPLPEGMSFINPLTTNVYNYSTQIQAYDAQASASSKDLQVADTRITVNYSVNSANTPALYQTVGTLEDVQGVIIRPVVQESVKAVTARYTAEELITKRDLVKAEISEQVTAQLDKSNIVVSEVSLTNFKFDAKFQNSVEEKQIAEQKALTAANNVNIARQVAQEKVVNAQADAEAILARATAQADANRLLSRSITNELIRYETIQKWDGVQPRVVGDSDLLISVD